MAGVVFKLYMINTLDFQEPHIYKHMIMWLCLQYGGFHYMCLLPDCHSIIFMTVCVLAKKFEIHQQRRQNHVFGKWGSDFSFISKFTEGLTPTYHSLMTCSIPY